MKRIFAVVAVLGVLAMLFSAVSTLSAQKTEPPKTTGQEPVKDSKLSLQITSVASPVKPGEQARLLAHTSGGAVCRISVYYTTNRSAAEGLADKTAEASGNVSWSWKIGTDMKAGTYRIEVTSTLNGTRVSQTTYFTVAP